MYKEKWRVDDDFFFDDLSIGNKYCFVTTLHNTPIGFLAWDPRNLPDYAIVGDNCIIPEYKGNGYGTLQLQKAVNRMASHGVNTIYVSTNHELIPAQNADIHYELSVR